MVFKYSILLSVVAVSIAGCSEYKNAVKMPVAVAPANIKNLVGKSDQEILGAKYNKAVLTCALWVQLGKELQKSASPSDTFSWDLLKEFSTTKEFKLAGKASQRQVDATLTVKKMSIFGLVSNYHEGATHVMKYTPVADIELAAKISGSPVQGVFENSTVNRKFSVYEKLVEKPWDSKSWSPGHNNDDKYFDYLECTIDTDLKPEYADHFRVEQRQATRQRE